MKGAITAESFDQIQLIKNQFAIDQKKENIRHKKGII